MASAELIVAPAGPGPAGPKGDHLEVQHLLLCGVHAINHLLQEKKLVWNPEEPRLLVPMARSKNPKDPKDNHTRINMSRFCDIQVNEALKAGIPRHSIESCNPAKGNIPADIIVNLLRFLDYDTDDTPFVSEAESKSQFVRAARFKMQKAGFLGMIVNIGRYHWTALTPYLNSCWDRNAGTGRLSSRKYAYVNSLPDEKGETTRKCIETLEAIETYLRSLKGLERMIFVYSKDTSYNSIAKQRQTAVSKGHNITHIVENNSSRRGSVEPLPLAVVAAPAALEQENNDDEDMKAAIAASMANLKKGGRKTRNSSGKHQRRQSFKARQSHH
jgi:hypothetical protein